MRLAIVGASARAAAFSALAAGHEVVAADLFADLDLSARCPATAMADWPQGFGPWIAQQQCDGWFYTGGLENYPQSIDAWALTRPLLGVRGDALRAVRDPLKLAEVLDASEIPTPDVCFSRPASATAAEWLAKSRSSSGGLGVRTWQSGSELRRGEYLQRRIPGHPIAAVYVAAGGEAVCWGVTRQLIAPPWTHASGFQYAGSIGPLELGPGTAEVIELAGRALAHELSLEGVFGIDLVIDLHGTPWVIEANPRYTASMEIVERARGLSAVGLHVAACRQQQLPLECSVGAKKVAGKAYLFAPENLIPSEEVVDYLWSLARQQVAADLPRPGALIRAGAPVTTLFAEGGSCDEVEQALQRHIEELTARMLPTSVSE
jgi:uncharacterized protein